MKKKKYISIDFRVKPEDDSIVANIKKKLAELEVCFQNDDTSTSSEIT